MKTPLFILSELKHAEVNLSLDESGDNLKLRGNVSALSQDLKHQIRENKASLISFLREISSNQGKTIPRLENLSSTFALSPSQKAIWLHEQMEDLGVAYIIPSIYFYQLDIFNEDLFREALTFIVKDNDVFRLIFSEIDGVPIHKLQSTFVIDKHLSFQKVKDRAQLQNEITVLSQQKISIDQPLWSLVVYELPESNYCFYLRLHHLIGDGESLHLFINKLIAAYTELLQGKPLVSIDHLQYQEYVAWINTKENFTNSSEFWKKEFANYESSFELNPGRLQNNRSEAAGKNYVHSFSSERTSAMRQWAITNRVSLASLYTAVAGIVLSKHGNSSDFVVGIPTASRNLPQLMDLIGDLVNTLPLRLKLDYSKDKVAFVHDVQSKYLSVLDHELYPFEYILEDIQYERKSNEHPLFNVMISVVSNAKDSTEVTGENQINLERKSSLYDLTFTFIEHANRIDLDLEYASSKFENETIGRIAEQLEYVLDQILDQNQMPLSEITLVDQTCELNETAEEAHGSELSVVDFLRTQVEKNPHADAVVFGSESVSYSDLMKRSRQMVGYLIHHKNVKVGDRIAVTLEKSIDQLICMYSIWMAGGIYVPIDSTLLADRKQLILTDCDAKTIIDPTFLVDFKSSEIDTVAVDSGVVSKDSIAYLLYTSGTTGIPKGVMISHSNLVCKLQEEAALLNISPSTVSYTLTNLSFDVSFLETALIISYGGKVVVAQQEELQDTSRAIQEIGKHGVTHLQGTPTYFTHFVSLLTPELCTGLESLNYFCIGGESMNDYLVQQLKSKLPWVQINNHYGPTEITIDALVKQDISSFKNNSIGKTIGDTRAFVVDEFGNLLPVGVTGELVIGGPGVFQGYWNDELLSNSKLMVLPFTTGRFYKTGDFARLNGDAEIEFFGRKDEQVKLRGYRIELDDINQTLKSIDGVEQAVSQVVDKVLVSWVVSQKSHEEIQDKLGFLLPEYMIPQIIQHVEEIPMNDNGKVAFRKLPEPANLQEMYVAPRTEIEVRVMEIWQEVLGIKKVGIYDNFFALGGHSLKITQLASRYQNSFEVQLSIKDLFSNATVFGHSELLTSIAENTVNASITKVELAVNYPVSYSQQRMWVLSQMEEGSRAYHMPTSMKLKGQLNVERFVRSIEWVVDKHESLRTIFVSNKNGDLRQKILTRDELGFSVDFRDVRELENPESYVKQQIEGLTETLFDLSAGPLVRVNLFLLKEEEYVFYYCMHHIISDGWSMEVLTKEVMSMYQSKLTDVNINSALSIQYKDYASWQVNLIEGELGQKLKTYWINQFSGELPILDLPNQKLRPAVKSFAGRSIQLTFPKELTNQLKSFCQREGGTLFMGLLAGLKGVLHRYTNQIDIVVGTPIAGRTSVELEDQIGMYANTLALRTQFKPTDSFSTLFSKVKETTLGAYEHQIYPFDKLVNELDLARDLSRNPLFDVMLVMQNTVQESANTSNHIDLIQAEFLGTENLTSRFDSTFTFAESNGMLNASIEYNTDLYSSEFIHQLFSHYKQFIAEALKDETLPISSISYLSEEERTELLVSFNDTHVEYPKNQTICTLFEDQVERTPNDIAVVFENRNLTYHELNELSNQFAHYLRLEYVISPDDLIGVKIERSHDMIMVLLGILKSGAAYVPIDLNYPDERVNYIIQDSEAKVIIDSEELKVFFDRQEGYSKVNPERISAPNDLAYIIYTSGTTGNPKGVMITHSNAVELINWALHEFDTKMFDSVLAATSYCFDLSIFEIFYSLSAGKKIRVLKDATEIKDWVYVEKKCLINTVPSVIRSLLEENVSFENVSVVNMAGEVVTRDIVSQLPLADLTVYNLYGPSEDTTYSTYHLIEKLGESSIPIGKPISNTQVYILDENLNPLPVGGIGTIYISGGGISRGYLNQPNLTAEKFISNQFREGSTVMYNSGDRGRWLKNGTIEYLGRNDFQVKIRGYRIELGEIESAIIQYSTTIKQVVVVAKKINNEDTLVAFYVSKEELDQHSIVSYLQERLPKHMIPLLYKSLESFPLNQNGKIDRKSLLSIHTEGLSDTIFVAPGSKIEKQVVNIWEEVLGVKNIGLVDNFFELGGHSLKITQLISRYQKAFNVELSMKALFLNSTPKSHSELIENSSTSLTETKIIPIPESEDYPVSYAQQRMWILSQMDGGSRAYHIPISMRLRGELNVEKFTQTIESVIDKHESLRTVFVSNENGDLRQKVLTREQFNFKVYSEDIREFNADDQSEYIESFIKRKTESPFDLFSGPLLRVGLLQLSSDEFVFFYNMHHIISDGWSIEVLAKDVLTRYGSLLNGREVKETLPIQYKDFAVWQINQIENEQGVSDKDYWLKQFSGELPVLDLPSQKPRPTVKTYNGETITFNFTKELTSQLNSYCQKENGTLFMGLLAGLKGLLYRYTYQNDIIIGTPIAGRTHIELEDQIGLYVNTLALRTQFSKDECFNKLFSRVKETTVKAYDHQGYPIDKLINELDLPRDTSRNPLFDVMLVLQNTAQGQTIAEKEQFDDFVKVEYDTKSGATSQFDITFAFSEVDGVLYGTAEYNKDIYSLDFVNQLTIHYQRFLEESLKEETTAISQVSYMDTVEIDRLVHAFNDKQVNSPKDKTIINLFEEQVEKSTDTDAVVFEEEVLSFSDLNERANQFAHYLREKYGIQPNDVVAIQLDRSERIIFVILGILKSGAAYLPIDVNSPFERTAYIKDNSRCKVLVDQVELEEFLIASDCYSKNNVQHVNRPSDLAYIIYTSGTTGNPKGVMVEHRNLVNIIQAYKLEKGRSSLTCNYVFDVSVLEIFSSLVSGGTLYIPRLITVFEPKDYALFLAENGITHCYIHPMHVEDIAKNLGKYSQVALNRILIGVEPIQSKSVKWYLENGLKVINGYGPTESTICATFCYLDQNTLQENKTIPIGSPVENTQIYILDEFLQTVPVGVKGTIYISGEGLTRGYLNNPELTKEKYVENPFSEGAKMYDSGDLAYWLSDGNIQFLGRNDQQVKIKGHRIELGEIEAAIVSIDSSINQSVVELREDQDEKYLVAYFISTELVNISTLRDLIRAKLPEYMVPKLYKQLDSFPLTPNGKIDRKKLASISGEAVIRKQYVAPQTNTEALLAEIWQEVLEVEHIGIYDDFFELGGYSLKATHLINKIYNRTHITVSLSGLYENSRLVELASYLDQKESELRIEQQTEAVQPLSQAQFRIWLNNQMGVGRDSNSVKLRIEGAFEFNRFRTAVYKVIERHEILRTTFHFDRTLDAIQRCHPIEDVLIDQFVIQIEDESDVDYQINAHTRLPLFKFFVLENKNDTSLFIISDHIIYDGISVNIFFNEIRHFYGNSEELPPLNLQYKDYSKWEHEAITSGKLRKEINFWVNEFSAGIPYFELSKRNQNDLRADVQSMKEFTMILDRQIYQLIKQKCKELAISEFSFFQGILKSSVYELTGQKEIVIGQVTETRDFPNAEKMIGLFLNTLPVKTVFDPEASFIESLKVSQAEITRAHMNKNLPFNVLLKEIGYKNFSPNRFPIIDIFLSYIDIDFKNQDGELSFFIEEDMDQLKSSMYVKLNISIVKGQYWLRWEYNSDLYSDETIEKWSDIYNDKLQEI